MWRATTGAGVSGLQALIEDLGGRGFAAAFAGITLPNPRSVGLFEALSFEHAGTWRAVGYKLGEWHDVGWWQRRLPAGPR